MDYSARVSSISAYSNFETPDIKSTMSEFEINETLKENQNKIKIIKVNFLYELQKKKYLEILIKQAEIKEKRENEKLDIVESKAEILNAQQLNNENELSALIFMEDMSAGWQAYNLKKKEVIGELTVVQIKLEEQEKVKNNQKKFIESLETLFIDQIQNKTSTTPTLKEAYKTYLTLIGEMQNKTLKNEKLEEYFINKTKEDQRKINLLKNKLQIYSGKSEALSQLKNSQAHLRTIETSEEILQKQKCESLKEELKSAQQINAELRKKTLSLIDENYVFKNPNNRKIFFGNEDIAKLNNLKDDHTRLTHRCNEKNEQIKNHGSIIARQLNEIDELNVRLMESAATCLKTISEKQADFNQNCENAHVEKLQYMNLYIQSQKNYEEMFSKKGEL